MELDGAVLDHGQQPLGRVDHGVDDRLLVGAAHAHLGHRARDRRRHVLLEEALRADPAGAADDGEGPLRQVRHHEAGHRLVVLGHVELGQPRVGEDDAVRVADGDAADGGPGGLAGGGAGGRGDAPESDGARASRAARRSRPAPRGRGPRAPRRRRAARRPDPARCLGLAHDLGRRLVLPQPLEHWVPELAVAGPLGEGRPRRPARATPSARRAPGRPWAGPRRGACGARGRGDASPAAPASRRRSRCRHGRRSAGRPPRRGRRAGGRRGRDALPTGSVKPPTTNSCRWPHLAFSQERVRRPAYGPSTRLDTRPSRPCTQASSKTASPCPSMWSPYRTASCRPWPPRRSSRSSRRLRSASGSSRRSSPSSKRRSKAT